VINGRKVTLNGELDPAELFDPESFNPELTTEGLVAGRTCERLHNLFNYFRIIDK
jgi:hypothetical protein